MLKVALQFIEKNMHPTIISAAYVYAMTDAISHMKTIAKNIDLNNEKEILQITRSTIATKFTNKWGDLICKLAIKAVQTIIDTRADGTIEVDIKRYIQVEKLPGGYLDECRVLDGIVLWKDVIHPKMKRRVEKPRIMLLDCGIEYKKGESQTNIEMNNEKDFENYLHIEEDAIKQICDKIINLKPNIVLTEKGCSDLAQHFLATANISVIRRNKKWELNRVARACGAIIGHQPDLMTERDIGTRCNLFEIRKIGDEYFTFFEKCKNPKACSIILRGGGKDVLQEIERNLVDAMNVVRNIFKNPLVLPGGGATEIEIAHYLRIKSNSVQGQISLPYKAVADALEIIPRTIANNCGAETIRLMTILKTKNFNKIRNSTLGINGETGTITTSKHLNIWEPFIVKESCIKTSIEAACMLLRIDDIVSGVTSEELDNYLSGK